MLGAVTLASPPLGDSSAFSFRFIYVWKVLARVALLIPHLSLEVLFWLRCGLFEIFGLVVATDTFTPPSLGDALNFCFCFLFSWKVLVIILIPHLSGGSFLASLWPF
jgi:hypothetical protein